MNQSQSYWYLENVDMTEILCPTKLGASSKSIEHKNFRKGDYIFLPGEYADKIFFIMEGRVKIGSYSETGKEITKPELEFEGTGLFEFSPTEDLLLVGTRKTAAIEMFGLPDWKKIHVQRFDGVGVRFNTLKFGPSGKWIVRILNHKKLSFIETATGKEIRSGEVAIDQRFGTGTEHLFVSSDGKYLATYTYNHGTEVWDVETLSRVIQFPALLNLNTDSAHSMFALRSR